MGHQLINNFYFHFFTFWHYFLRPTPLRLDEGNNGLKILVLLNLRFLSQLFTKSIFIDNHLITVNYRYIFLTWYLIHRKIMVIYWTHTFSFLLYFIFILNCMRFFLFFFFKFWLCGCFGGLLLLGLTLTPPFQTRGWRTGRWCPLPYPPWPSAACTWSSCGRGQDTCRIASPTHSGRPS